MTLAQLLGPVILEIPEVFFMAVAVEARCIVPEVARANNLLKKSLLLARSKNNVRSCPHVLLCLEAGKGASLCPVRSARYSFGARIT